MASMQWYNSNEDTTEDEAEHKSAMHSDYEGYDWPSEKKCRNRGVRVGMIVVAVLLGAAFFFGAGVIGNRLLYGIYSEQPYGTPTVTVQPSGLPNFPTDDTTPTATPYVFDETAEHIIEKSAPLEVKDYAGSAGQNSYATLTEAIAHCAPSVVEIATETVVSGGWLGNYVTSGAGSGVIISAEGFIVTNNHVIEGASNITVRLPNGNTYAAQLIGRDENSDIAVIFIEPQEELSVAKLGCSADLLVGEAVFAIGNPLGSLGGTVTNGIISATARDIVIDSHKMTLLQTNAAVNPGNSGGGLFNMAGQLIGVVNAKYSEDDVEGIGFAIPVDKAYTVIEQLIRYGYVRGIVDTGFELYDISEANIMTAWRYFYSTSAGVYILSSTVSDEFLRGDRIVALDGVSVSTKSEVEAVLAKYAVGDTVQVKIARITIEKQGTKNVAVENTLELSLVLQEYVPEGSIRFEN